MSEVDTKLDQIEAIENGRGLRHILNEAGRIVGNPMLVHEMGYGLVEAPDENIPDDPAWVDFMTIGRLSDETIEFIKNECFIDAVANSDGTTYLISEKWKYNRIFGQIYDEKNMPIADLVCVASNRPFDDNTPELIKAVCKIVSRELGGNDFYLSYGQRYQEEILKELIEGTISDKRLYSGHVANIDAGLKEYIHLALVDLSSLGPNGPEPSKMREILSADRRGHKFYLYKGDVVILLGADVEPPGDKDGLQNLNALLEKYALRMGVSEGFHNLYKAHSYYTQALRALSGEAYVREYTNIFFYHKKT